MRSCLCYCVPFQQTVFIFPGFWISLCPLAYFLYSYKPGSFTCAEFSCCFFVSGCLPPHPVFLPDSYRALPSWSIAFKVLTENLSFGLWTILQPPSSHPKHLVFLPTSIQPLVALPQPGLLFGTGARVGSFSLVVPAVPSTSVSGN